MARNLETSVDGKEREYLPAAHGGYTAKPGTPYGATNKPHPVVNFHGRIVAVLAGQPRDPTLTYGKGQRVPTRMKNDVHSWLIELLLGNPDIQRMATFSSALFGLWAPKVYDYYKQHDDVLRQHLPHLRPNFSKSILHKLASGGASRSNVLVFPKHQSPSNFQVGYVPGNLDINSASIAKLLGANCPTPKELLTALAFGEAFAATPLSRCRLGYLVENQVILEAQNLRILDLTRNSTLRDIKCGFLYVLEFAHGWILNLVGQQMADQNLSGTTELSVKDMVDDILLACSHRSTGALQMNEPQLFVLPPTLKVGFDPEIELLHHMWATQPTTNGIDIRQTIWHIVSHDDGLTAGK
ncbi:hypothetical protein B0H14DRAFT_2617216 [Mycena olivaceomarginata]|nr:hypothetical protein B0H14DRAFT_2617216 [Mycena olivaceomarginata]